jgi:hypothetical protein
MSSHHVRSAWVARSFVAAALLSSGASAQRECFVATLDGAQEVPAVATAARGTGVVIMDRAANTLAVTLCYTGLTGAETAAHIHGFAAAGANAGVKFNLPAGPFKTALLTYPEADEASYLANLAYFNIHSAGFPTGEIRGQLTRSNSPYTYITLANGVQEVPANASPTLGVGWFRINTFANTLNYSFTRTNFATAETVAHIHGFAAPGANAGVKINLPVGAHKAGTLAYLAADEASYIGGLAYINVHSSAFPGGEIRGQIVPGCTNPSSYCTGKVNSQGCTPSISSTGVAAFTSADDLHITCSNVINNKSGVLFWGGAPLATPAPFLGGFNCVKAPVKRTPVQGSGGTPPPDNCSGTYDFHFTHAYMTANLLVVGSQVQGQYWYRDPAITDGTNAGLSNAISFVIAP